MSGVTIRDIALAAGVSPATVSRVLNQKGNVTPQAEARVRAALQQYKYVSPARRQTGSGRRTLVALITSDICTNFSIQLIKTVGEHLRREGYSLLVGATDEDSAKEREYLLHLQKLDTVGIILNTAGGNDELICSISHHTPLVLMNRRVAGSSLKCDYIDTDNIAGAELMIRYLINRGHTRIGVLNGNTSVSTGRERSQGSFRALRELGVEDPENYLYRYDGDYSERTGLYGARYLLEQTPPPTAIVAMNDLIMVGAIKYFLRHKIRVPDDISIIGYGDMSNSELFSVGPHYITQNPATSGEKAVNCLLERIKTPNLPNREIIFTSSIVEGHSVRSLI